MLDAQLKAVSHFVDTQSRRKDGFNQSTSVETRVFDGNGKAAVWLKSQEGYIDIATSTGLIVKVDLNGDYAYTGSNETLTLDTHFWLIPDNAGSGADPKPWGGLELIPTNTVATVWPQQRRAIQVTAKFGFPEVPEAIKELTINLTRMLRDVNETGMLLQYQAGGDGTVQVTQQMDRLTRDILRAYARPPSF